MPLPTKSSVGSKEECISKTYRIERNHGKDKKQARAIALSHCSKLFGDGKKQNEEDIDFEDIEMKYLVEQMKALLMDLKEND